MSEMIQYMVRDPQGSVYGPAPMELIKQWVREGRISAGMQLAPEGTVDWKPAGAYEELRELFAPDAVAAATGKSVAAPPAMPGGGMAQGNAGNPYAATTPAGGGAMPVAYGTPGGGRTNPLAIASLVVSILGCSCCLVSIAGVVMGVIAKKQIKESQGSQSGDGLATAGIIIGVVMFILSCCGSVFWMFRNQR